MNVLKQMKSIFSKLKQKMPAFPEKLKIKGIQQRWFLSYITVLILVVVVAVTAFSIVVSEYYYSSMRSGLEAKAKTTADFFGDYISQSYNDYYQSCITYARTFQDRNFMELQFITADGTLAASSSGQWSGTRPDTPDIAEAAASGSLAVYRGENPATGEHIMAVSSPMVYSDGEVIGIMRFVTSMEKVNRQILAFILIAVGIGFVIIALLTVSSALFIRSIVGPVREVTAAAKRIASGSYGVTINRTFRDELGELAETVNDMSLKIAQTEKMQTEFVSSVSHELRTPLTAISGWSETLQSTEELDPELIRRGMQFISREASRLTGMVEELLEFTSMQDGRFKLNMQVSDILAEFEDTVFMYANRLEQDGIDLIYIENNDEIPEILCDTYRLRQVFLNILDNAAKHGGDGRRITASIHYEKPEVVIQIRDFGPGIPEEELPHVKKKFYKGSSKARGSGIGLAVCDEIITRHGGTLKLENAEDGGTLVTIRLPDGQK